MLAMKRGHMDEEVLERAARIASFLDGHWNEELVERLNEQGEAALGLALARALAKGWVETDGSLADLFDTAETFIAEYAEGA